MFDGILLEAEQEELLKLLVEASRSVPRDQRRKYLVSQTNSGDFLIHSGVPESRRRIYFGDIEILSSNGLVLLGFGTRGTPNFDVTPLGFKYYEHLIVAKGEPVSEIEDAVRRYIDQSAFSHKYPNAYSKWVEAEKLLWSAETESQYTTVGHLCREAMQEFAEVLASRSAEAPTAEEKSKTVKRIREALTGHAQNLGDSHSSFLDALLAYWGTTTDLVQRQEHGAAKEIRELVWEDARLVTFQTLIAMYEIDRAISR